MTFKQVATKPKAKRNVYLLIAGNDKRVNYQIIDGVFETYHDALSALREYSLTLGYDLADKTRNEIGQALPSMERTALYAGRRLPSRYVRLSDQADYIAVIAKPIK